MLGPAYINDLARLSESPTQGTSMKTALTDGVLRTWISLQKPGATPGRRPAETAGVQGVSGMCRRQCMLVYDIDLADRVLS